jgi:hypothetical protein
MAREEALDLFVKDLVSVVKSEWSLLKKTGSSGIGNLEVKEAMSKYAGTVGTFGDTEMFQDGLENQLGSPDPFILTGILRDNVLSDQSRERSITSNYKIVFSLVQKYARVLGNPFEYERGSSTKLEQKGMHEDIPNFLIEVAKGLHPKIEGPTETELKVNSRSAAQWPRCRARAAARPAGRDSRRVDLEDSAVRGTCAPIIRAYLIHKLSCGTITAAGVRACVCESAAPAAAARAALQDSDSSGTLRNQ